MDLVHEMLAFAGFHIILEAVTNENRPGRSYMDEVYLELCMPSADQIRLPAGVSIHLQSLVVECSSRNQGWAGDALELNLTYNGSHTWSEVAVTRSSPAPTEIARAKFTSNFRTFRQPGHRVKEFSDPSGLLRHVALGDRVQLILRSMYPEWRNMANYGRIRARFDLEFGEDAQFPPIPVPMSTAGAV